MRIAAAFSENGWADMPWKEVIQSSWRCSTGTANGAGWCAGAAVGVGIGAEGNALRAGKAGSAPSAPAGMPEAGVGAAGGGEASSEEIGRAHV